MRRLLVSSAALLALVATAPAAHSQSINNALVVSSCGGQTYTAGTFAPTTQTTAGQGCTNSSGGGGGGNVTIVGPLGAGADSTGVTVTLATSGITDLNTIAGAITAGVQQANVKQVNGTTVLVGAGATGAGSQRVTVAQDTTTIAGSAPGTAGTPSSNVVTVQGPTSGGTALPVSISGNQAVNLAQVNGVTTLAGAGASGTGAQRVTVSQDSTTVAGSASIPAGTNIMGKVGIDQTTVGTTNGVSIAQIGSTTVASGNGTSGAGNQRMNLASDNTGIANWGHGATGSAVPAGATYAGAVSSGSLTGIIQGDNSTAIAITTATTTQIIALSAGKKTYITEFDLVVSAADNITIEYGTGTNCASVVGYLVGSASASQQFAANGGIAEGGGLGPKWIVPASDEVCIVTSAAANATGSVTWTQF